MLKVADIMTRDVFTLDMDTSVEEAAWSLTRRNIGGAPVTDASGRLAGFLSRADLVNPTWSDWVAPKKATVGDVMNPAVLALAADSPALRAAEGMAARHIHHVVVVNDEKRLVGMISSLDVVRALAQGLFLDPAQSRGPEAEIKDLEATLSE
jgi:CBS-domain-containing membrane protein